MDDLGSLYSSRVQEKTIRLRAEQPGTESTSSTFYLGFDRSTYPGDLQMDYWWSHTPLYWTGFYLAPAPSHANTGWMSKRSHLAASGWGMAPLYVGRQAGDTAHLTAAQGTADALNAGSLAATAGFPHQTYLFLDIETGGTLSNAFVTYIAAWVNGVILQTNYHPGVYCSYTSAAQLKAAFGDLIVRFWCWNLGCPPSLGCSFPVPAPGPTGCGVSYAQLWQYAQSGSPGNCSGFNSGGNCDLSYSGGGYPVDLDTSSLSNPGI